LVGSLLVVEDKEEGIHIELFKQRRIVKDRQRLLRVIARWWVGWSRLVSLRPIVRQLSIRCRFLVPLTSLLPFRINQIRDML
jgi:hypothetical protein